MSDITLNKIPLENKQHSYKDNYLIMLGHMADDLCQGSLPAILAFMYKDGVLTSYSQIALLIMVSTIVNAVAQPLVGFLSDKKPRPYLMTLGMCCAALGIMFLGVVDNFYLMLILVSINGIGVATFHPVAGKLANVFAGERVGKGMSIFSVGGNIGYAIGALYFTFFYNFIGLTASLTIILPALLMSFIFIKKNRYYLVHLKKRERKIQKKVLNKELEDNYLGTFILLILIFFRSAAMFGITTFLPLYYLNYLQQDENFSNITISIVGICGAFATFFGGPLADKFGFTQFVRICSLLCLPFICLFLIIDNPYLALIALMPFAFFYYAAMSPTVVIGQKLLPKHIGMATGITIGLGISFGGVASPFLGYLGQNYNLHVTMIAISIFVLGAFLISLIVPIVNKHK